MARRRLGYAQCGAIFWVMDDERRQRRGGLLSDRGAVFWAVVITLAVVATLFVGSQIARNLGQNVEWYTGFGQWLGALGSFAAAIAALWISVSDRRINDQERRRVIEQQDADLRRQAGLVRVTAEMLYQIQAVGPKIRRASVGIRNRRTDRIFDIEVVEFVHQGAKTDLTVAQVNGFAISPPRKGHEERFPIAAELPGLALNTDECLVIYQQELPDTPADYVCVAYTDSAGRRWRVDTEGSVTRL